MSDLVATRNHHYRVMRDTCLDRFGLSYYFVDVELRSTPAVRVYRKDYNYVSELVATATSTRRRRGADIDAIRHAVADALTIAQKADRFVSEKLKEINRSDESPLLLRHRARVLHPVLASYLNLIAASDRALSGLNWLLAFNAIDDKAKINFGLPVVRSLLGIKSLAMRA